jgi:subtilase family serine protease
MSPTKLVLSGIAASFTLAFSCNVALAGPALAGPAIPDIASKNGITIGAAGKSAPWGGAITLTESDAFLQSNGKCAFNVSYDMENLGATATGAPFKNRLVAAGTTVSEQSALKLGPNETQKIDTQAYLAPGNYALQLHLDADNNVTESNEGNNLVAIKINFNGKCTGAQPKPILQAIPKPDIVSKKGITIGGAVGGSGGKSAPWGGSIHLATADAFLKSNGKCAFNVSYDMENIGGAPAGPAFVNRLYSGSEVISIQSSLNLNTGESKQINTQAYLAPGSHAIRLVVDADNNIAEGNEANNSTEVRVMLDSNCSAQIIQPQTPAATGIMLRKSNAQ